MVREAPSTGPDPSEVTFSVVVVVVVVFLPRVFAQPLQLQLKTLSGLLSFTSLTPR